MFIALDSTGKRIDVADAEKGNDYFCPVCNGELRVKEGSVNIKHFSHISRSDCDDFTIDMSEWHRRWQEQFPIGNREVVIEYNGEKHRADVSAYGHVIEFQHSSIPLDEFHRRNDFYTAAGKKVIWIFDLIEAQKKHSIHCFKEWHHGNIRGGIWKWSNPKRIFKHFIPQNHNKVILLFQILDTDFTEEDSLSYLERVSWATIDEVDTSCYASFRKFETICFPQTKTELFDWIKNRETYDAEERKILETPIAMPQQPTSFDTSVSAKNKSLTANPSVVPPATHRFIDLKTVNIPLEKFHQEAIVKDKNGNKIILCTKCNRIFYDTDMTDYRYAKGICRECSRKQT